MLVAAGTGGDTGQAWARSYWNVSGGAGAWQYQRATNNALITAKPPAWIVADFYGAGFDTWWNYQYYIICWQ
jgi:hypothetical protein